MGDPPSATRLRDLWIFHHPVDVLGNALPRLRDRPDAEEARALEGRYRRLARRAHAAVRVRAVLLVLFYLAAVATLAGGVGGVLGRFLFLDVVYRYALALSAGFSVLFWTGAAVLHRYIGVLRSRLTVAGIRIAAAAPGEA